MLALFKLNFECYNLGEACFTQWIVNPWDECISQLGEKESVMSNMVHPVHAPSCNKAGFWFLHHAFQSENQHCGRWDRDLVY